MIRHRLNETITKVMESEKKLKFGSINWKVIKYCMFF